MVDLCKTHNRHQATFNLNTAYYLLASLLLCACSETAEHNAIQLHFKTPEHVINIIEHLVEDTSGYKVSGNQLLASPDAEKLKTVLSTIKKIDKPPQAYQLALSKQNGKQYSTNPSRKLIALTEGRTSTIRIAQVPTDILIIRASENSSLIKITTYKETEEKKIFEAGKIIKTPDQVHNWIIKHKQHTNLAPDIFKNGFTLTLK